MQSIHVAHPYYITPHAAERFGQRVDKTLRGHAVIVAIQSALQQPEAVRGLRSGALAYRARTAAGQRFACVVQPYTDRDRWPVVVTVAEWWRWRELRVPSQRHWTGAEDWFLVAHLTLWTPEAIARALGRTPSSIRHRMERLHQGPTNQDLWTSGPMAARLGCTPQHLTGLARAGHVPARRVPGGRWWLFDPERVRIDDTPREKPSEDIPCAIDS